MVFASASIIADALAVRANANKSTADKPNIEILFSVSMMFSSVCLIIFVYFMEAEFTQV